MTAITATVTSTTVLVWARPSAGQQPVYAGALYASRALGHVGRSRGGENKFHGWVYLPGQADLYLGAYRTGGQARAAVEAYLRAN